ncbi:hypothetical protein [Gorillibacterium sp. sgz5001074]|uniref:hypothetical protein n=1 Tax=Gorillibacterium sp. sgz5001074 TaxID=3446695 RepID=UPI003F66BCB9
MEAYQPAVAKRLKSLISLNGAFSLLLLLTAIYANRSVAGRAEDFVQGMQIGVFLGMEVVLLYTISKLRSVLKSPEALKKMYIEENDERSKLIKLKSGAAGSAITLYSLAFGAVMSGFFDYRLSITLFGVLVFVLAVYAGTTLYYKRLY